VGHPNYVKKVRFPLEVLPVMALSTAAFHAAVGLGVLVAGALVVGVAPSPWMLVAPLCLVPLALFALALGWLLSSLGVYVRDIGYMVGIALQVLMFMSPVFYPVSAVPERLQPLFTYVPTASALEQFRRTLLEGRPPAWGELAAWTLVSLATASLARALFERLRRGFADVL